MRVRGLNCDIWKTCRRKPTSIYYKTTFSHSAFNWQIPWSRQQIRCVYKRTGETLRRHNRSSNFYTKRNWDQKTEVGLIAKIEHAYHEEINNIKPFKSRNHSAISEYFLLWGIRYNFYISRADNTVLNGISGSDFNKEKEEVLENKGYAFARIGGIVPSRFTTGIQILMQLDQQRSIVEKFQWGLLKAKEGEFIVADCYKNLTYMPISPSLAFCVGHDDIDINEASVANANGQSTDQSNEFYFGRNLSKCPIA